MSDPLEALFNPSSIALVGASAHPEKMSHVVLKNLKKGKFKVYPVNPKEHSILGLNCYPSVESIRDKIDLAVISLPAQLSVDAVKECASKGVRGVIVTSSGFGEASEDGKALEREMLRAVQGTRTRILGPNTMGVFVPSRSLDTLFIPTEKSKRPRSGSVAIVSQSGAVAVSFLEKAEASGIGVSSCVGLGNKLDINENDVLDYLSRDKTTGCIAMYLESFSEGRGFIAAARAISPKKPIIVLKSGRTPSGSKAASSHTGAIASSSDGLVDGAMRQAGIVRAYDEEELMDYSKALSRIGHIKGDRICVVASAGGFGVIASDLLESRDHGVGLKMARLSGETVSILRGVVPSFSSVSNPVDLTASVTDEMYDAVLETLQRDSGIDGIMMSLELQPPGVTSQLVDIAQRRSRHGRVPIIVSAFAGDQDSLLSKLEEKGVVAYPTIWRAVRALAALRERGLFLNRLK